MFFVAARKDAFSAHVFAGLCTNFLIGGVFKTLSDTLFAWHSWHGTAMQWIMILSKYSNVKENGPDTLECRSCSFDNLGNLSSRQLFEAHAKKGPCDLSSHLVLNCLSLRLEQCKSFYLLKMAINYQNDIIF